MRKEKSWLTCKEAASLLDCTPRTIINLIKKKNISTEQDERGTHFIPKADFFRVFPEAMVIDEERNQAKSSVNESRKILEEKIRHLQDLLDERRRHNEFLITQINIGEEKQSKMLETINSQYRLLERDELLKEDEKVASDSKPKSIKNFSFKKLFSKE